MSKSNKSITTPDEGEAARLKKLQFKNKKLKSKERNINYKNIRSLKDLDEYEDYNF